MYFSTIVSGWSLCGLHVIFVIFRNNITSILPALVFHVPPILAAVELGVSIAGFVAISQQDNMLHPTPYSTAGAALVLVIHLFIVGMAVAFWRRREQIPALYMRGLTCVLLCAIPLAIRIVYSLIYASTRDMMWNTIRGNASLYLFLSALPEIVVVAVCCWAIVKLPPKQEKSDEEGGKSQQNIPLVHNYYMRQGDENRPSH